MRLSSSPSSASLGPECPSVADRPQTTDERELAEVMESPEGVEGWDVEFVDVGTVASNLQLLHV